MHVCTEVMLAKQQLDTQVRIGDASVEVDFLEAAGNEVSQPLSLSLLLLLLLSSPRFTAG